jgi:hypothetical protein
MNTLDGSMDDTPKKATTSVPAGDTQNHRLPAFVDNLGYITYVDDTKVSVFKKLYNSIPVSAQFTSNQLNKTRQALKASEEWEKWKSDVSTKSSGVISQKIFFSMLQKAQNLLQLQSKAKSRQARNVFINIGTKVPASGIDSQGHAEGVKYFKPDLASVSTDVDKGNVRFCDMKTAWELKKSSAMEFAQSEVVLSLLRCNQVFRDDPFRLFIYSIYVAGNKLRLYQLNRGTVLCYESGLNIEKNIRYFLYFVNWLMLAEDKVQGLREQPAAIGGRSIRFFSPGECNIPSPLVRVGVDLVTTRGTTVWPVKLVTKQSTTKKKIESLAALKLTWAYKARRSEADILLALSDVEELPKVFAWEDGPLTNEFDVLPNAKHSSRRLKLGERFEFMRLQFSQSSIRAGKPQTEEITYYFQEVKEIAVESIDQPIDQPRKLRWYLEEYCGVSVDTSPEGPSMHLYPERREVTEVERIKALRSAVQAIRKMFCREQPILHRDISPANIMVTSSDLLDKEGAPPPGRLIDVDLACIYGDQQSGAPWRTGTYLYMAISILKRHPPKHNPWHDIESVFWVLFFGELNRTPKGAGKRLEIATCAGLSSEAARAGTLASVKGDIVGCDWASWMGNDRLSLFGKTSLPVVRLMHRLRTELFEFNEHKEQRHLATLTDVAEAAEALVLIDSKYIAPRFAVPKEKAAEKPSLEERIEELNLEKNIEEPNLEKDIGKLNLGEGIEDLGHEENVRECSQGTSIEKLKQAVITITERIEGWFTECIEGIEGISNN